ncbi:pentapeptide repeat-containing protein [Tropicimonas sp. S265A]|uniref:pentapeptide repeat-containing protein n=1 Tax=Tropicimonas sp. S265A TaxID=3415134 RepID=UPI003C7E0B92
MSEQTDKLKAFVEWLGFSITPDFSRLLWLGRLFGWGAAALYAVIILTLAVGLIAVLSFTIGRFVDAQTSTGWEGYRWFLLTIATLTATLAAAIALPFTVLRTRYAQRHTVAAEQNLITDRINKAVEGLGAEKLVKVLQTASDGSTQVVERSAPNIEVRVGAILSLERISENSPEDHIRIMEILCAYVRENACIVPVNENPQQADDWKQRTDTQMALTVIGRRAEHQVLQEETLGFRVDFRRANLQLSDMSQGTWQKAMLSQAAMVGAALGKANLSEADLTRAKLHDADLSNAKLQDACLWGAGLQRARLWYTKMQKANLTLSQLQNADMIGANLGGAHLGYADLSKAKLWDAKLDMAHLGGAILREIDFENASFVGANLCSTGIYGSRQIVDLSDSKGLTQKAINSAFGVKQGIGRVILPPNLVLPDHWHVARETDTPGNEDWQAARDAYNKWAEDLRDLDAFD